MKKRAILRGVPDGHTSYSLVWLQAVRALGMSGMDVNTLPLESTIDSVALPRWAADTFVRKLQVEPWEIHISTPTYRPNTPKEVVFLTMWESTRMPPEALRTLNNVSAVMVPSEWQQTTFSAQGVNRPIFKVPLCIDTDLYRFTPKKEKDCFVFGMAGATRVGGSRKRVKDAVDLWRFAFDGVEDVRLEVKLHSDDPELDTGDERITTFREFWDRKKLARWYQHVDCYASISRGEGWSWHAHEAMATGRPVVAPAFGGISEFLTDRTGYPVPYSLGPADGHYREGGLMADVDEDAFCDLMRQVYKGGTEVDSKACHGSAVASQYGYAKHGKDIQDVLQALGYL